MIPALLGVPGKLKTLLTRIGNSSVYLTDARVTALDNLDAAVTTRAAASTALSNATWTDARAAKLDVPNSIPFFNDPRQAPYGMNGTGLPPLDAGNTQSSYFAYTGEDYWDYCLNYQVSVAANNTWYTICDLSGGGLVGTVCSPRVPASGTATIDLRFTVDGVIYTLSRTSVQQYYRLWWNLGPTYDSTNVFDLSLGQRFGVIGATNNIVTDGQRPWFSIMRYSNGLKIEARTSNRDTSDPEYLLAAAAVKRDGAIGSSLLGTGSDLSTSSHWTVG